MTPPYSSVFIPLIILLVYNGLAAQNYSLEGRIIDQQSGQVIEYASITLHSAQDSSLIDGVVSDENGRFLFEKVPSQTVYIVAQFLGYEAYTSDFIQMRVDIFLGDIALSVGSAALDQVEVTAKATRLSFKADKQVFDAQQFKNARGGSATDVISNLPAVSIDAFGEISVRGTSGFLVMINGKPVQSEPSVVLNQLAANSIQDIEIITAPSAKYDPDGKAGIINIITKQRLSDGFSLNANTLIGLPGVEDYDNAKNTPRYGADLILNYRKNKLDLSVGLDYRRYDISGRREGYVNTYLNEVLTEFPSDGERSFDEENYSARLSATFTPTNKQVITAGFYFGKRTKERTADILYLNQRRTIIPQDSYQGAEFYYDRFLETGDVLQEGDVINNFTFFNENLRVRRGDFIIASLDYNLQLNETSSLNFSGLYEHTILGGPTDNVSLDWPGLTQIFQLQFNDNDNPLDGVRLQVDYKTKAGSLDWENGYQFRYLFHPGDFVYFDRDLDNEVWIENPLFTNQIELERTIHAAYSQLSGKAGRFQFSGGLRLEYFDRSVKIASPDSTFLLDQFNLFPSANINYDLQNNWNLKAAYSRRIQRTTTFKMTPFPEREHSETLEQGDAELLPEYIDLVELGVVKNWGDNTAFATLYYRHVDNVINRVNTVFNDTILNRIYTNAGQAQALGLEIGTIVYPTKWWRLYLGANVFDYSIEGNLFGDAINTSTVTYSINATSDFNLNKTLSLQLGLNYLSERVTAQGRDSRFYNPSLTLKQSFFDKKLNIALQWRNIDLGLLNSNEQRITTVRDNFYTTTNYVYEVDILQLNISYQINQFAKKEKLLDSEFGKKEF